MSSFVKSDVLEKSKNITQIDVHDIKNLIPAKEITLSFTAREAIRSSRSKLKDQDILMFRIQCQKILQSFCSKLVVRSPLKYELTQAISCLDPRIAKNPDLRKTRFSEALDIFIDSKWLNGINADKIQKQFEKVCKNDLFIETLKDFDKGEDRLDDLWIKRLIKSEESQELVNYLQMIFILSHGNASVERGFSVNKECLVENLEEESLIAQRLVHDTALSKGGVEKMTISKKFILSCRNAYSRYSEALKKLRLEKEAKQAKASKSKMKRIKLKELQSKKKGIIDNSQIETSKIDDGMEALEKDRCDECDYEKCCTANQFISMRVITVLTTFQRII